MPVGRGKGQVQGSLGRRQGGVRLAKSVDEVKEFATQMLGATLVTIQTGPAGKQVNRLYLEDGSDIEKEFYLSLLVDRETSWVSFVVSTEGGMDIEKVAHDTPEKIVTFSVDPAHRHHGPSRPHGGRRRSASRAISPSRRKSLWRSSIPRSLPRTWRCWRSIR